MKLTELDPGWLVTREGHDAGRVGMGISFQCPCCINTPRATYLAVWFANPVDGGPPAPPECDPKPRWSRIGDTFETMSLSPSVDASSSGHWHGFITGGEVR